MSGKLDYMPIFVFATHWGDLQLHLKRYQTIERYITQGCPINKTTVHLNNIIIIVILIS